MNNILQYIYYTMAMLTGTHHSWEDAEEGSSQKAYVVAGIEPMPVGTEHEDCHGTSSPVVDDMPQPMRSHLIPAREDGLHASCKLW